MEEEPLDLASEECYEVIVLLAEPTESSEASHKERKRSEVIDQYEFMHDEHPNNEVDLVIASDDEAEDFVEEDDGDARELMLQHGLVNDEATDLREAMELLAQDRWQEFLQLPVIHSKLGPAFVLLDAFGIGKGTANIKKMWDLLWQDKLVVSERMTMTDDKCIACVSERSLGYKMSERRVVGGVEKLKTLGYMGPHCYRIRFNPLKELVEHCLMLPLFLGDANFDDIVQRCLTADLNDVIHANESMRQKYKHVNNKRAKKDYSGSD